MPTTLVTGVSGYLGTKAANRLINAGHRVIGIDLAQSPQLDPQVEIIQADILHAQKYLKVFEQADTVIHSAALVPLTRKYNDYYSVNVLGSRIVAQMALEGGVRSFVHISSSAVFGANSIRQIDSSTETIPIEPYGKSKLEGERAVVETLTGSKTKLAIVRPRTIIGPDRGGIFDLMFRWIKNNSPIFTIGKGDQPFQFVHVDDLIDYIVLATEKKLSGIFNVGTDRYEDLNSMYFNLIDYAGSKSRVVHLPPGLSIPTLGLLENIGLSPLAPWHYKTFHLPFSFDVSPLAALGWQPKYSNDEMFRLAYDSHLEENRGSDQKSLSPHTKRLESKALTLMGHLLSSFGESSEQFAKRTNRDRS